MDCVCRYVLRRAQAGWAVTIMQMLMHWPKHVFASENWRLFCLKRRARSAIYGRSAAWSWHRRAFTSVKMLRISELCSGRAAARDFWPETAMHPPKEDYWRTDENSWGVYSSWFCWHCVEYFGSGLEYIYLGGEFKIQIDTLKISSGESEINPYTLDGGFQKEKYTYEYIYIWMCINIWIYMNMNVYIFIHIYK